MTEALDPVLWRERYAFGITLGQGDPPAEQSALDALLGCKGSRGKAKTAGGQALAEAAEAIDSQLSDDTIRWHLRCALSDLEIKSGIPFGVLIAKATPVDNGLVIGRDYDKEVPRLPFVIGERNNYYRIDLPAGVISVERVRAMWFGQLIWTVLPTDGGGNMLTLEHPGTSSLHILPTSGVTLLLAGPALANSSYGALQTMTGYRNNQPAVWAVDYTLGPRTKTGQIGEIEVALAHWVACRAGILLLSIGGGAYSKGLTSASLSIDGLSKSIGLQASAIYGVYSATETRLKEAEEGIDWKALATYKRGLRVRPFGSG